MSDVSKTVEPSKRNAKISYKFASDVKEEQEGVKALSSVYLYARDGVKKGYSRIHQVKWLAWMVTVVSALEGPLSTADSFAEKTLDQVDNKLNPLYEKVQAYSSMCQCGASAKEASASVKESACSAGKDLKAKAIEFGGHVWNFIPENVRHLVVATATKISELAVKVVDRLTVAKEEVKKGSDASVAFVKEGLQSGTALVKEGLNNGTTLVKEGLHNGNELVKNGIEKAKPYYTPVYNKAEPFVTPFYSFASDLFTRLTARLSQSASSA